MGRWSRQRLRTELRDAAELVLAPGARTELPLTPAGKIQKALLRAEECCS